jgi:thioredoxin-like negative regulator of GroEL
VVRKIAEMLAGKTAVVQINTEENRNLAERYAIQGIPALCLLRRGRVVDRLNGAQSVEAIISWFNRAASRENS